MPQDMCRRQRMSLYFQRDYFLVFYSAEGCFNIDPNHSYYQRDFNGIKEILK